MRVLLISTLARGGPVSATAALAEGLIRRGHEVGVVCATAELAARYRALGARVELLEVRSATDLRAGRALWRATWGWDVAHAQDRRAGWWLRLAPRRSVGAVRVYTVHGLPDPYLPPPVGPSRPGPRALLAYRLLDARLAARADALVVASRALRAALVERLGFPAELITVIPNGVNPAPPIARSEGPPLIATVGLLEPVKALAVFLHAAALLHRRHPSWRFALFGSGSQRAALQRLRDQLGLAQAVALPGFVPAAQALAQTTVFVLCSYYENCPLALLEAMARGLPVVCSAVGGIPELIDSSSGWLVAPGDPAALAEAIEDALRDPARAAARGACARRAVIERFSLERHVEAHEALYAGLLEGG